MRSLTAEEIVAQVDHCFTDREIDATKVQRLQIMFMSMGEPMLNYKQLERAIIILNGKYPQAALLISTSAPDVDYMPLMNLAASIGKIGLQFSVHESTDARRNALIPFKAKLNLEQIVQRGMLFYLYTGRQPFFNYCANTDNSSDADADRLLHLFNPKVWQATVSVVCESTESVAASNDRQKKLATDFMDKLLARGFSVRCFDPAGQDDIGGGCGQLWFVQEWMREHPELAKKSVGFGISKVHAPC